MSSPARYVRRYRAGVRHQNHWVNAGILSLIFCAFGLLNNALMQGRDPREGGIGHLWDIFFGRWWKWYAVGGVGLILVGVLT